MCEPITLTAISATMAAVGAVTSAVGAAQKGAATANAARYNSGVANGAAADAVQRAGITGFRAQMKGSALVAAQRTETAATGSDVDAGSAEAIQGDAKLITQMDEDLIRNNAARDAYGYRTKGQQFQQEARYAQQEATQSELGSFIGGIGKVAGIAGPAIADSIDTRDPSTGFTGAS